MSAVPVLEVGGTHVTAALVDIDGWIVGQSIRLYLDSTADAEHILGTFARAGAAVASAPGARWGVAMPDPFDYARGVATFQGVGKFDAIRGTDVGAALMRRLPQRPSAIAFLNDADAFILGEWLCGAAAGHARCVGITLGTGVGSGWLVDGRITHSEPGVPPLGRAHHLTVNGAALEETVSRRAIRRAYAATTGDEQADVSEIAERARGGEERAADVLRHAFGSLGAALAPSVRAFGADVIVFGGSMTASWDLLEPWWRDGLDWPDAPPVLLAADPVHAGLIGAARYALDGAA
jgi:glucokinase